MKIELIDNTDYWYGDFWEQIFESDKLGDVFIFNQN